MAALQKRKETLSGKGGWEKEEAVTPINGANCAWTVPLQPKSAPASKRATQTSPVHWRSIVLRFGFNWGKELVGFPDCSWSSRQVLTSTAAPAQIIRSPLLLSTVVPATSPQPSRAEMGKEQRPAMWTLFQSRIPALSHLPLHTPKMKMDAWLAGACIQYCIFLRAR